MGKAARAGACIEGGGILSVLVLSSPVSVASVKNDNMQACLRYTGFLESAVGKYRQRLVTDYCKPHAHASKCSPFFILLLFLRGRLAALAGASSLPLLLPVALR